jgi:hypothetical protein
MLASRSQCTYEYRVSGRKDEPKNLARLLLNTQVRLPTFPETAGDTVGEESVRLGDEIPKNLVEFLLAAEVTATEKGTNSENAHQLETLAKAIHLLSKTGQANRGILGRGEALLEDLIPVVKEEGERVRAELNPQHPFIQGIRLSSGEDGVEEVLENTYLHYLGLSCAAETLETLLDGLRRINTTLKREPGRPPR